MQVAPIRIPPLGSTTSLQTDGDLLQGQFEGLSEQIAQLQKQFRQAQKLASLGIMSAILAHEFNNLLTPVVSYSQYVLKHDDPELLRSAVQRAYNQTSRVAELCKHILDMAVEQDAEPSDVALRGMVEGAVACLGRDLAKDNITLAINVDPDLYVRANPPLLQQVFFNLILNARQAILGRPGRLDITATRDDQTVHVAVSDTGSGIEPDALPHIFEPFFSTKRDAERPDKRGIGLGLVVCKDIVEDHGGSIEVESTLGQGTTFSITLPSPQ